MPLEPPLPQSNGKPLVTKDEIDEGSRVTLTPQDSAAKDNAVIATLQKMKGMHSTPAPPVLQTIA